MKKFFFTFLLLGVPALLLAAEEGGISVKAEIDKAFLTIGERVEYRVTLTHDPAVQILSPIPPPPSNVFELKEVHDFSEKQGKQIVEGRRFILTTYELGEFILDPISIRYRNSQGQQKTVETTRLFLTVHSVDTSGKVKTDIRNVKGALELPQYWWQLGGWLLFAFITGIGIFMGWRWRRRSLTGEAAPEPVLSAEDEALLRLNRLFDSDLLRQAKVKEYFLEFSEILRRYFERRFEILAVESTTSEILRDLRQKEIPDSLFKKIHEILDASDLAKFAKWKPPASEIMKMNQLAKSLIEEARPSVSPTEEIGNPASHGV